MDVRLAFGVDGADLVVDSGDLVRDEGLVTAVVVSLLSDGLAPALPDVPLLEQDRRGYWAEQAGDPYGSLLWTLKKDTAAERARARELVASSLAWLTDQGIASSVEVETSRKAPGSLQIDVVLVRGLARRWASLWDATAAQALTVPGLLLQVQVA